MEMNVEYSSRFYPLLEIWFRPRRTIRRLVDQMPGKYGDTLAVLYGTATVLIQYTSSAIPLDSEIFVPLLRIKLTLWGIFWGYISIRISGVVAGVVGRRLGDTGTNKEALTAIAWSNLPLIVCYYLLWIPQAFVLDGRGAEANLPPDDQLAFSLIMLCRMVASIWSTYWHSATLAEVHRFPLWRGFVTMLAWSAALYVCRYVIRFLLNQVGIIY